jgi:hypothetical protein
MGSKSSLSFNSKSLFGCEPTMQHQIIEKNMVAWGDGTLHGLDFDR